jgi:hypothetical protein
MLHNDRHNAPGPPLDELLVHLIALHRAAAGRDRRSLRTTTARD